jgi:hypothetical protein
MENPVSFEDQKDLPNSTAILVLGIVSIAACWCWGVPGLVCGIVAISLASKSEALYNMTPSSYKVVSYSNVKAGKVCAIIGVSLSSVMLVLTMLVKFIFGAAFLGIISTLFPFWANK